MFTFYDLDQCFQRIHTGNKQSFKQQKPDRNPAFVYDILKILSLCFYY